MKMHSEKHGVTVVIDNERDRNRYKSFGYVDVAEPETPAQPALPIEAPNKPRNRKASETDGE